MPYKKHGKYDQEKRLPDNTGQAQGSGLIIWLHHAVEGYWPEMLAYAEQQADPNAWILNRLRTSEDEDSRDIYAEYVRRRRAIQAEQRLRERKSELAGCQAQLVEARGARREYLDQRIAKLKKSIAKAEADGQ